MRMAKPKQQCLNPRGKTVYTYIINIKFIKHYFNIKYFIEICFINDTSNYMSIVIFSCLGIFDCSMTLRLK